MKKIIIITGDPNSINSELLYKCFKKLSPEVKSKIYLISNYELIKEQLKKLKYYINLKKVRNIGEVSDPNTLKLIDIDLKFKDPFKIKKNIASRYILKCLNRAHKECLKKDVVGLINCSIDKGLLNKEKIGVTEYFASKCGVKDNSEVMLIKSKKLAVSPLTTHIDLKDVPKKIKKTLIKKKIRTIDSFYKKIFKKKPYIGVLGLNPHNAELRKKSEEKKTILPSIFYLKKKGYKINGPLVADSLFMNGYSKYDVILGMYHDQVLTPFKTIFRFDAINITLGLKYLRLSPDHGTAKSIIGKNKANPLSLLKCINFLKNIKK